MSNEVDYFEIGSPDPAASRAFYSGLFDWTIAPAAPEESYSMVNGGAGGLWDTSATGGEHWAIFYVHVDDVAAAVQRAVTLGGSIVVPLVDNGAIQFAHLRDPLGNRFAVWRPNA